MGVKFYISKPDFNYAFGPYDDGSGSGITVPRTHRVVFTSSYLNESGNKVKLDIYPTQDVGPYQQMSIGSMYIGPHDGNLANADFTGTPTQVTFNSGNPGFTIYNGASISSDEINFTVDKNLNYMITYYHDNSHAASTDGVKYGILGPAAEVWSKYSVDESAIQNVSEGTYDLAFSNYTHIIKAIRVR